ncbi:hypothetical protein G7075_13395 [Phycicoccus sp. HDW14]|uniref:hypothetical protein n=1 Tax=Phycicoccus sp. HDW14 TaxID=2714941 RepID=UPI00140C873F|nr:hypothetical protein [Phycicoccus sp. HDW14]QIM21888.1 hypothetical protein G7075_13395 [Phycicoccus sp. HDW14]
MTAQDALVRALVDQHVRIRELTRGLVRAGPDARPDALDRLVRLVAVHCAAERVALAPPGEPPPENSPVDRDLVTALEGLDDVGAERPSSTVHVGLVAAALVRHAAAGERDTVPRFVATHDQFDIRWAATALEAVDALVADDGPTAAVPVEAGFRHQLRAAQDAVTEALRHG